MRNCLAACGLLVLGALGFLAVPGESTTTPGYSHVVWVVMENHSYSQIIGSSSAPYITSLSQTYGSATQMFAESHPSLPNYIAMTSGSTQGITDDSGPSSHLLNVPNLFTQLGASARSLEQSMPSNCDKTNAGNYAVRHDPAVYYTNYAQCSSQVVPLASTPDLSAPFTFITPDVCHDMHSNSCAGSSNVILQGDHFLKGFVPQLLASPEYQSGSTVIFVTWDEGTGSTANVASQIPTIVISPTTSKVSSATRFTHYSMLRTTEELLGLPVIGGAQTSTSMQGAFNLSAAPTTTSTSTSTSTTTPTTTTAPTTTTVPTTTTTPTTTTKPSSGWTNVVNDQFSTDGAPPTHWQLYHSPYGSKPNNCTSPSHDYVSGGYLHLVEKHEPSTPAGVSCPYSAGWYTGGMKLNPVAPYNANDQRVTVRYRIVSTGGIVSHHIIPMRWPTGITYQFFKDNGEEDVLESDSLNSGRTFLHYVTSDGVGHQLYSPLTSVDMTQWHTVKWVQRDHAVHLYIDDMIHPVWQYFGNSTTVPDVLRTTVLQQECNHVTGCPTGTTGSEDIQIDWITVDTAS